MYSIANGISSVWSSQNGHTEIFILDKDSSTGHKTVPHSPHRKVNQEILWQSSDSAIIIIIIIICSQASGRFEPQQTA